jgi:hypothetical protein
MALHSMDRWSTRADWLVGKHPVWWAQCNLFKVHGPAPLDPGLGRSVSVIDGVVLHGFNGCSC